MSKTRQQMRKKNERKTIKRGGYKSDEEIIAELQKEYVNKIMKTIRYYFKKQLLFDFARRNEFRPQKIVPSIFRKDPIENKLKISFTELKDKLSGGKCSLHRFEETYTDPIYLKWFDDLYSKIATVYINSKNIREFMNNKEMDNIREEYLNYLKDFIIMRLRITPENIQSDNKKTLDNYEFYGGSLFFWIDYHKQIGKRYFHIQLLFNTHIKNILTTSTKMMYRKNTAYYCNLFDFDGFKNYEIDDKTKLLTVLNTATPNVLDADTLNKINELV